MRLIFSILSAVVTIYTIFCFIDIILSWFPGAKFTGFGKFIASVTEPYLSFFRKIRFLQIGYVDFSPILALGVLSIISSVLGGITSHSVISFGAILGTIIRMIWGCCTSLLGFFFLILIIRLIALLVNHGTTSYNSMWSQLDGWLSNICYKISGTFIKKNMDYKKALITSIIVTFVILAFGNLFIGFLINLCYHIPF